MALFENFPYTNFHELNLDWIIKKIKELDEKFDDAISAKIKFADPLQWDITKAYEALTIVFDDNHAYLSLQPVPPGTLLTNTDYWQMILDMQEFYDEIDDLDERLSDEIDDLANDTQEAIQALDATTVKNNNTKHILYLGDSYSVMFSNALFNDFKSLVGVPENQIHSVAVSGAAFSDASNSFLMQVQGYTGDKTEITDIIVVGGINDALLAYDDYSYTWPNVSGLTNAMSAFKTYCAANYPNAKIHVAYVGGCLPSSTYYNTLHPAKSQEWAKWAYTINAASLGFNVLECANAIHASKYNYHTDGIHPSQAYGCHAIAEAVASAFNGNEIKYNRPTLLFNIPGTGKATSESRIGCFYRIDDDNVIITIPDQYIQITQNQTLNATDFSDILTFKTVTDGPEIRNPLFYNLTVVIYGFGSSTPTPLAIPAIMRIQDGVCAIKVYKINGNSYETLTAGAFATITFVGIDPIQVPLWSVN